MLDQPGAKIRLTEISAGQNRGIGEPCCGNGIIVSDASNRLKPFVEKWHSVVAPNETPGYQLELIGSPQSHIGLGTGTQLGLGVAALFYQYYFQEIPRVETLATSVGRGRRSAVGTFGFQYGGLIVDRGKSCNEPLAALDLHLPFPDSWRVLLIQADQSPGIYGQTEDAVFSTDDLDLRRHRDQLIRMADQEIVTALAAEDFQAFSNAVYEFGQLSGSYFETLQGGSFNGPRITRIIESVRGWGVAGVGQSSWGPTIYAFAESESEANQLKERLSEILTPREPVRISSASVSGASVSTREISTHV